MSIDNGFYWYIPANKDEGDWAERQVLEVSGGFVYMVGCEMVYEVTEGKGRFIKVHDPKDT